MTMIAPPALMTTEELLALPDDGVERDLIDGHLREKPVTRRSRPHSKTQTRLTFLLEGWRSHQPEPRGEVLSGEAGFRLRRDPDTTVGIDVAYIDAATAAATPADVYLIDGLPVLAAEVLSKTDTYDDVVTKVMGYLQAGVPLVWVVDPAFRTVMVYRPDAEPELFTAKMELSGDPHLPGLRIPVRAIFDL